MTHLTDQEIDKIVSLLKAGKPLPEDYKILLFDTQKEYELIYADKEREVNILADTMAVPLQEVKTFRNGEKKDDWTNMLIFGDNLQVLKTLLQMKQDGKLKNSDGTSGVRLVYIDPPFASRHEFSGSEEQKAYQDKIVGANFLEFLRKRLIFLREILSDDGAIYVHMDERKGHYVKVLLDEIFGENRFQREIIWRIGWLSGFKTSAENWIRNHDVLFFYVKNTNDFVFNKEYIPYSSEYVRRDGSKPEGKGYPIEDTWNCNEIDKLDSIQIMSFSGEKTGYPTQKNENLSARIIQASSNPGDLVMDCFAGSGTALTVAEKLGRRWIGVDCGKLAIYTMQKRLLNIAESKDLEDSKKKYNKSCKPFILFNAGLYDYKKMKELSWQQYRDFALRLFQCRDENHEISKIGLDGYLGADSVMVFNYQKHPNAVMDRGFIDDLHKHLGNKIGRRFFIIAPAASVRFLEDYIEKDRTKYFVLRIPYSIIEEIHNRGFSKIKQPINETDVNDTVDSVGFDFIQIPTVECAYSLDKPRNTDLLNRKTKECVIKVEKFESKVISRKPREFSNLETLSMVMLDYDFNGEVFDLDEVFYADDLKKNGYEVRFVSDKVKGQIMVIYIDIFGNEKWEIKRIEDFKG